MKTKPLSTAHEDAVLPELQPDDPHNRALAANVRPAAWINPQVAGRFNLVVVGGGTAGLVTAAGAAGLGARVALVERRLLGGDCLNVGCVPSKALLRAARAAADVRAAGAFGIDVPQGLRVDFPAVMERMRRLRAGLSPHDSAARFRDLGVDVFLGDGCFSGAETLEVAGRTLRFARACIATGARAAAPPIPGLDETGYLTNETVFSLTTLPARLAVIGAGPIGCELAQAFARFGSQVHLLESAHRILGREDCDAAAVVERALRADGVRTHCAAAIREVRVEAGERVIVLDGDACGCAEVRADAILVAVGRAPNVEGLGLERAGVAFDARRGVTVNEYLRTSNPRIYAAGDICSEYKFTHVADALARIVIQNALFAIGPLGRARADSLIVPWCTYTDPELAHVGRYERETRERGLEVKTITIPLADVDRAVLDGETEGFLRVHAEAKSGHILGATLVARHAGESIGELTAAMRTGATLGALAGTIHPYPTQAEAIKKAGDAFNRDRLTPTVRNWLTRWMRFRR